MKDISAPQQYQIRGVSLYGFQCREQCLNFLFNGGQIRSGILTAINAEKILTAEQDTDVCRLIADAEFKYADGISIVHSIHKKYPQAQVVRIAGVDLWQALMMRAGDEGTPVFLIGGTSSVLHETAEKLRQQWQVNIVGERDGYFSVEEREALVKQVAASGAHIVTVALGSPKQEFLMRDCKAVCPQALYMGVGGTYDVFTGHVKRAPMIWQNLGLEWLYRLISQPSRWRRQIKLLKYLKYYYRGQL